MEPGRIGNLELKTASSIRPWICVTDRQGHISEEAALSLIERARHGVGLVSLPGVYPYQQEGAPHGKTISLQSDDFIPQFIPIVKRYMSWTPESWCRSLRAAPVLKAPIRPPAPVRCVSDATSIIPRELTAEEIREHVSLFGDAARRAREAGIDAGKPRLHRQADSMFLSPYSNRRTDEYGGNTENRTSFFARNHRGHAGQGREPITRSPSGLRWTKWFPAG